MSNSCSSPLETSINPATDHKKQDLIWMLSLYGTAIGAGTLFLPIDAGLHGIWPLLIMAALAFPMTYFPHRALCRFVLSSAHRQNNITDVVKEHFGPYAGLLLTVLYFFAIYPILLMYSVAITNTTQSFIIHQLGLTPPPRALLALGLIVTLMAIIRFGQATIIKSMSVLVYPFIVVLLLLSVYLIPHWNTAIFHQAHLSELGESRGFLTTLWLALPVMIFSFNHSPIISSFAVAQKQRFGNQAEEKSAKILKNSHLMMVITVMFFVFSCVFSLSPHDLVLAKQQNISILSYLANHFQNPLMAYVAPCVAFIAISKSFFGHYLGAQEGLNSLLVDYLHSRNKNIQNKQVQYAIEAFIVLSCWLVATINPNILNMIETLGGPIITLILFLMPMYAIFKVPAMKKYAHERSNIFVTVIGLIAIFSIVYGMV